MNKTGLFRYLKACFAANLVLAIAVRMRIIVASQSVLSTFVLLSSNMKEPRVMSRKAMNKVLEFRRMIAQLSFQTWKMLPHQHQIWIGIDDLIEDGMFKAYQLVQSNWHDTTKSALSTSIYHAVRNHLYNEYTLRYSNEMRFNTLEGAGIVDKRKRKSRGFTSAGVVPLDAVTPEGDVYQPPELSTSEETIYNNVLTDCFVVPVLGKIYKEASSKLQDEMIVWFLQNKDKTHLQSPKFRRAAKEFRMLAKELDLTYTDCEHLIRAPLCMNKLSHELLSVPFDMEHPTPSFDKEL